MLQVAVPAALSPSSRIAQHEHVSPSKFEDEFTLVAEVGRGAHSVVHSVRSRREPSQALAAKVIQKEELASEQAEQVLVEIRALAMLRHKHVVRVLACHEDDQRLVLVMERARYDLYEALTRAGLFSEARTRRVMQQLLSALEYLHRNGVIHRDIKPENLLLDGNNDVKVADFGWSTVTGHKRTTFCGTLDYLAPEMLGESYDERVDIWSLGVLMYELLVGKAPFDAEENEQTQERIRSDAVSFPADATPSAEARELLLSLLQKDPEQRLSLQGVLDHPWLKRHAATTA